jgi:hypothetical protein
VKDLSASALQPLLAIVVNYLATSEGPPRMTPQLLALTANSFQCQWAVYWRVQPGADCLRADEIWTHGLVDAGPLEHDTRGRSLGTSEGAVGQACRMRKPIWTTVLGLQMDIPRSLDAQFVGFSGGLWIPVQFDTAVYGVIEVLGLDMPPPSKESLELVELFGRSMGGLLERH